MSLLAGLVAYFHPLTLQLEVNGSAAAAFNPDVTGCPGLLQNVFSTTSLLYSDPAAGLPTLPFLQNGGGNISTNSPTAGGPDDFSGPWAIEAWCLPTSTNWCTLISRSDGGTPNRSYSAYLVQGNTSQVYVDCSSGGAGSVFVTMSQSWVPNKVNHIVVSSDGNLVVVWLNGGPANGGGRGVVNASVLARSGIANSYTGWGQERTIGLADPWLGPAGIWRRPLWDDEAGELWQARGQFPFGVRRMGRPLQSGFAGGSRIIAP